MQKIGFGGSCHWCTEAIFRSIKGVIIVEQGWIGADGENVAPSEAVIVGFNQEKISLETLIAIHLHTHSCTSNHNLRGKYRSAVYYYNAEQARITKNTIHALQLDFDQPIITNIMPLQTFRLNEENYLDYYYKDPAKPFCQQIVNPKLKALLFKFAEQIAPDRQAHLNNL